MFLYISQEIKKDECEKRRSGGKGDGRREHRKEKSQRVTMIGIESKKKIMKQKMESLLPSSSWIGWYGVITLDF